MKITLQAKVLAVERATSSEEVFTVALDCGQPFKTASGNVGAMVIDTIYARPADGYFVLRVLGQPTVNQGDQVAVEIEPA